MLLAQITDLHIALPGTASDTRHQTAVHLQRAVAHLLALSPRPDAVICTGDLVEEGSRAEYERLVEILNPLSMPVYVVPGNHDDRENLRATFRDRGYLPNQGFLCYAVEVGPVRLVGLDTHVPGQHGGQLCRDRLAWLDACLAEAPEQPTLLFQHHPPFATGLRAMDAMGLKGAEGLTEVVRRHPQVERIVCGHLHRPIMRRFAGTIASTCPSTAYQAELVVSATERLAIVAEPSACMLHLFRPELGLVSHLSYIGDYGPPDVLIG